VAVSGTKLDGGQVIWEIDHANGGAVNPHYKKGAHSESFLQYDSSQGNDYRASWFSQDGRVSCNYGMYNKWLVDANKHQNNSHGKKYKPLWVCLFKDGAGGDTYMKLFVMRVSKEYMDYIVSYKKDYSLAQNGLCGNFDCDAANDAKDKNNEQPKWIITPPQLLPFRHLNSENALAPDTTPGEVYTVQTGTQACADRGITGMWTEMCGNDLSLNHNGVTDAEMETIIEGYHFYSSTYENLA